MNTANIKLTEELDIKRIVMIDDELNISRVNSLDFEKLDDAFNQYKSDISRSSLRSELLENKFSESEIKEITQRDYIINTNCELNSKIQDYLIKKEYYQAELRNEQLENLKEYLHNSFKDIPLIEYKNINSKIRLKSNDLIIVDYNLGKVQKGYAILDKINSTMKETNAKKKNPKSNELKHTQNRKFYYLLFISSKPQISYLNKPYNLMEQPEKNEFFRKLRSGFNVYDFVVFNFLHKDLLDDDTKIEEEFSKIAYEFRLTKTFFKFLNNLSYKIDHSKTIVFNDFYSLNLRTLKNVIKDNIENEGVSEFEFFNDLICKLISKENSDSELIRIIHESANEIKSWEEPIIEYHLDKTLLEIREKELYKNVNIYFSPVQFGDIFTVKIDDANKLNLLAISQQCDMTIRSDGERATKNVTLLKDDKSKGCCDKTESYDLERRKLTSYYWYKREPLLIPADILDLASTNSEGICRLNLNTSLADVVKILFTDNHKKRIEKFYDKLVNTIREVEKSITSLNDDNLKAKLRFITINGISVHYDIDENENVDFRIKRINRLDEIITQKIQQGYANQLNRVGQALAITGRGFTEAYFLLKVLGCNCKKLKIKFIEFDLNNKCILIDHKECIKILNKFCKNHEFLNLENIIKLIDKYSSEPFYFEGDNTKYIRIDGENLEELKNHNIELNIKEEKIEIIGQNIDRIYLAQNPTDPIDDFFVQDINNSRIGLFVVDKIVNDLGINYSNLDLDDDDIVRNQKKKLYVNLNAVKIKELIEYTYKDDNSLIINSKCLCKSE